MLLHVLGWVLTGAAAAAGQLVLNAGFEQAVNSRPRRWELFVQPMDGAYGRLTEDAFTGGHAVMLHIPQPYAKEPANNWNQTIFGAFSGQTLEVTGMVKTEAATDAAIWLQCWQQPARLLYVATSAATMPLYGTADWREVRFEVTVPEQTDFLVLRCVLQGQGSAWFDDIALSVREDKVPSGTDNTADEVSAPATADTAPPPASDTTEAVLDATRALRETVAQLRESNAALQEQFQAIEAELEEVRAALSVLTAESPATTTAPEEDTVADVEEQPVAEEPVGTPTVLVPYGTAKGARQ